jgi:hypothetical protein
MKRLWLIAALFALQLYPAAGFWQSRDSNYNVAISAASSATCTYQSFATENAGLSTAIFTSVGIGTAASNRVVAVIPMARATGSINTVSSVAFTVGATASLSQVTGAYASYSTGIMASDIWYASVPAGTTATITVVWSNVNTRSGIYVYTINTATPTPAHGANNNGATITSLTQSITVPANGCGIAAFTTQQTGNTDTFSSGAALDNASALAGATNGVAAGHTTTTGSVSVTASSVSTGNTMTLSLASWSP